MVGGWAGGAYGVFLTVTALRWPPAAELTGHRIAQPAFRSSMALLLAIPWLPPSFVLGLSAFLLAHLCFLGTLVPLAGRSVPRLVAVGVMCVVCAALLVWFWPQLGRDRLTIPVTAYIVVLGAMICAALLARLPTIWTAAGAVCFAVSDAMIGIGRFIVGNEALAVPIWWAYAAAQVLITAGFFFGREHPGQAAASGES